MKNNLKTTSYINMGIRHGTRNEIRHKTRFRTTQQSLKNNWFLFKMVLAKHRQALSEAKRETYSGLAQRKRTGLIRILTIL
jgi:hypothetical protein